MRLGNLAGQNRGKKYLKISGSESITPENQAKANNFAKWFSRNYEQLKRELVAKKTVDEDQMNDTYLRIYEKIIYGGLDISDYKAYFHRAFFTNYIQNSIKRSEIERYFVSDEKAVEIIDEDEEDEEEINQQKQLLFDEITDFIKECYPSEIYEVFFNYLRIGDRNYESVCIEMGLSRDYVLNIINKVRNRVRHNKELMRKRKSM
ncbi:MAG TPA: hypothetical protein DIT04_07010 [Dysgonomonas sp.]|nr:hypothetical protein [Dysgonomonas sp.]